MKIAAKDFKMTELGPIPKDWEVKSYEDVFTHIPAKGYQVAAEEYLQGGAYPVVDQGQEPIVGFCNQKEKVYSAGDDGVIVFGDHTRIVKFVDFDFVVGADGTQLLKGKECSTRYLAYILSVLDIPNLGYSRHFKYVKKANFAIPPLPEQRKIAAALSDVDEMIAALEKLIEKKRKIKTGAMQRLLTGKTRLPGFKGAWVEKRFEDVFVHVPSKTYQIAAEEYLSGGLFPVVDQGQSTVVGFSNRKDKVFRVNEEGVIVFGDHTRIIKYVDFDFVVGADGTQLLLGNSTIADTRFLSYCLERLDIPNLGYSRHFKYVKDGVYALPHTLAEQKAIAKVLGDMDAEIAALEAELAKAHQLKQGMMQELLTGKVRLPRAVTPVVE